MLRSIREVILKFLAIPHVEEISSLTKDARTACIMAQRAAQLALECAKAAKDASGTIPARSGTGGVGDGRRGGSDEDLEDSPYPR